MRKTWPFCEVCDYVDYTVLTRRVRVFLLRLFFQLLLGCLISAEEYPRAAQRVVEQRELLKVTSRRVMLLMAT